VSVQLVILGLLSERPRHGYELRQAVERRAYATYINLSGGSLYYNLSHLEQAGHIEKAWTEQKGKYPARQVFQITPEGREFLQTEVRRLFFDIDGRMKYFDPLHAALAFGHHISSSEVGEALTSQLQYMRQRLQEVEEQRAYWLKKGIPFFLLKIIDHAHVLLKAEIAWLEESLTQLSEALGRPSAGRPSAVSEATRGSDGRPELSEASRQDAVVGEPGEALVNKQQKSVELAENQQPGEPSEQSTQADGHPQEEAEVRTLPLTK
jgi:DNA-binding PadR family transcriptional regulator